MSKTISIKMLKASTPRPSNDLGLCEYNPIADGTKVPDFLLYHALKTYFTPPPARTISGTYDNWKDNEEIHDAFKAALAHVATLSHGSQDQVPVERRITSKWDPNLGSWLPPAKGSGVSYIYLGKDQSPHNAIYFVQLSV